MFKVPYVFALSLMLLLAHASMAEEMRKVPWNWLYTIGLAAYEANQIYWMVSQNLAMSKIKYPDREDLLPQNEQLCKRICSYHSRQIYEHVRDITNINGVTVAMSGLGFL